MIETPSVEHQPGNPARPKPVGDRGKDLGIERTSGPIEARVANNNAISM
jgi:hypothetical protein